MKKKILIIFVIIIVMILVFIIGFKVNASSKKDELANDDSKREYFTYLVYNSKEIEEEDLEKVNMVFAFNSDNVCVDCRMSWTFSTEEIAKENYQNWEKSELSNLKIEDKKVVFNDDIQVGKTKDEIKNTEFGNFEILEY